MKIVRFLEWLWMPRNEIYLFFRPIYLFSPLLIIVIGGILAEFILFRKKIKAGIHTFFSRVEYGGTIIKKMADKYGPISKRFMIKLGSRVIHDWIQIGLKIKSFVMDESGNIQQFTLNAGTKLVTFWVDAGHRIRQITIDAERVTVDSLDELGLDFIRFGEQVLHVLEAEISDGNAPAHVGPASTCPSGVL